MNSMLKDLRGTQILNTRLDGGILEMDVEVSNEGIPGTAVQPGEIIRFTVGPLVKNRLFANMKLMRNLPATRHTVPKVRWRSIARVI